MHGFYVYNGSKQSEMLIKKKLESNFSEDLLDAALVLKLLSHYASKKPA